MSPGYRHEDAFYLRVQKEPKPADGEEPPVSGRVHHFCIAAVRITQEDRPPGPPCAAMSRGNCSGAKQ